MNVPGSDSSALQTTYRVSTRPGRAPRATSCRSGTPRRRGRAASRPSPRRSPRPARARAPARAPRTRRPRRTRRATSDRRRRRCGAAAVGLRVAAAAATRAGSCSSNGASPATVRYFAGARSHSPRHGLGCSPGPTVAPFQRTREVGADMRDVCRLLLEREQRVEGRDAVRLRRAAPTAGVTRSRARPRSPSRRGAAPRAARGGGGGGSPGRRAPCDGRSPRPARRAPRRSPRVPRPTAARRAA